MGEKQCPSKGETLDIIVGFVFTGKSEGDINT